MRKEIEQELKQLLKFIYSFSGVETVFLNAAQVITMAFGPMHIPDILHPYFDPIRNSLNFNETHHKLQIKLHATSHHLHYISTNLNHDAQYAGTIIVGPYLLEEPSTTQIQDIIFTQQWPIALVAHVQQFYQSLPIIDKEKFHTMIEFIQYTLKHSSLSTLPKFHIEEVTYPFSSLDKQVHMDKVSNVHIIEERYRNENQLMSAIEQGNLDLVQQLISSEQMNKNQIPDRFPNDPLRSRKNLSFVRNTTMRKAAEFGGVHPIYIDSISEKYAIQIEKTSTVQQLEQLIVEMCIEYCKLVQQLSLKHFSRPVRKSMEYIRIHLDEEITLDSLAELVNRSKYELSRMIKSETSFSLPELVNQFRIKEALNLLKNESLSITDIAQMVGYNDVNYFIKVFKKKYHVTPNQYRK